jgi:hypothetical protein
MKFGAGRKEVGVVPTDMWGNITVELLANIVTYKI